MGILTTIKKLLGIVSTETSFDQELIMHINSVFLSLNQIGLGPSSIFSITGDTETWSDFFDDKEVIEAVNLYVYLKVRLSFDPPTSSFVSESMIRQISELEFRFSVKVTEDALVVDETTTVV